MSMDSFLDTKKVSGAVAESNAQNPIPIYLFLSKRKGNVYFHFGFLVHIEFLPQ